ncbi:hypothetical protein D3C78_1764650 [compost metagenome]
MGFVELGLHVGALFVAAAFQGFLQFVRQPLGLGRQIEQGDQGGGHQDRTHVHGAPPVSTDVATPRRDARKVLVGGGQ